MLPFKSIDLGAPQNCLSSLQSLLDAGYVRYESRVRQTLWTVLSKLPIWADTVVAQCVRPFAMR